MSQKVNRRLLFIALSIVAIFLLSSGCGSRVSPLVETVEPVIEDPAVEETPSTIPVKISTYYWPWISHGMLDLSSGEVISGPDLFESDLGFIDEFTADKEPFTGRLIWLVQGTDVFTLEWIRLSFNVDYYDQHEWEFDINYLFEIDGLLPEAADDGLQEFVVNLVERQDGFEVVINKVLLGKEQKGSFSNDPINFIALDLEMRVIDNP
ncbi:MAG: hypothetical protein U1E11_05825 [Dethiobacteria bacterium]|nr:hypothetical protein [Dethiobacteria bacterium]